MDRSSAASVLTAARSGQSKSVHSGSSMSQMMARRFGRRDQSDSSSCYIGCLLLSASVGHRFPAVLVRPGLVDSDPVPESFTQGLLRRWAEAVALQQEGGATGEW